MTKTGTQPTFRAPTMLGSYGYGGSDSNTIWNPSSGFVNRNQVSAAIQRIRELSALLPEEEQLKLLIDRLKKFRESGVNMPLALSEADFSAIRRAKAVEQNDSNDDSHSDNTNNDSGDTDEQPLLSNTNLVIGGAMLATAAGLYFLS